ncbi:MAG TPA: DUF5723 family protein [Candidatus Kapabacteria bacterium]|nr:DUF5723 family protein [Candidatus Kapabacteria bacterium]
MQFRTTATFVIILLTLFSTSVLAQEGYEHLAPVAHGAGRTYVVNNSGLSAVGLNPSLITPDDNSLWTISVFPISSFGIDAGSSLSNASSLSDIFKPGSGNISIAKRQQIADLLSGEKMSGRGDAEILGIEHVIPSVGTLAFTWTTHAGLRTVISDDFLNFLKSYESRITQYNGSYSDFDFQGMWYSEYSLTFAKKIISSTGDEPFFRSLSVGGALKYVSGTGYIGLDQGNYFSSKYGNGSATVDVNYTLRSAYTSDFDPKNIPTSFNFGFITSNQAGSGFGVDIGASAELFGTSGQGSTLRVGFSITDIGSISWSKNATERVADHVHDTVVYLNAGNSDYTTALEKKFSGKLNDVSSFTTSLPTMLRLGVALNLDKAGLTIPGFVSKAAIEFDDGLTSVVGSLNHPRIGLGLALEQSNSVASLRLEGGFFIEQGQSDLTLGAGTTIANFISIDLSSAHITKLFSSGSKQTDVALGIRLLL